MKYNPIMMTYEKRQQLPWTRYETGKYKIWFDGKYWVASITLDMFNHWESEESMHPFKSPEETEIWAKKVIDTFTEFKQKMESLGIKP